MNLNSQQAKSKALRELLYKCNSLNKLTDVFSENNLPDGPLRSFLLPRWQKEIQIYHDLTVRSRP